jgi:hypothetical protein
MKVGELILKLSKFDPELTVNLAGYEGGYYEPGIVVEKCLAKDVHDEWYYGPNDEVSDYEPYPNHEHGQFVVID